MQDQEEVEETPADRTERHERSFLGEAADILSDPPELDLCCWVNWKERFLIGFPYLNPS